MTPRDPDRGWDAHALTGSEESGGCELPIQARLGVADPKAKPFNKSALGARSGTRGWGASTSGLPSQDAWRCCSRMCWGSLCKRARLPKDRDSWGA